MPVSPSPFIDGQRDCALKVAVHVMAIASRGRLISAPPCARRKVAPARALTHPNRGSPRSGLARIVGRWKRSRWRRGSASRARVTRGSTAPSKERLCTARPPSVAPEADPRPVAVVFDHEGAGEAPEELGSVVQRPREGNDEAVGPSSSGPPTAKLGGPDWREGAPGAPRLSAARICWRARNSSETW